MPHVPQGDAQALSVYRTAMHEYHIVTGCTWPLMPAAPDLRIRHWWERVKVSKQRWLALVQGKRDEAEAATPVE